MADSTGHGPGSDFEDMKAHVQAWHGFLRFMKWQIILAGILLVFLLFWRTHN
ncbi:MAG TPA: hypothetical protein VGM17_15715 [Rhizomicrobium sp.]|jgi:hypothetical protein